MCKDTTGHRDDLSSTWWEKRTSSFQLSSDLHMYKCTLVPTCVCILARAHTRTHAQAHMQAIEETREKVKTTEIAMQRRLRDTDEQAGGLRVSLQNRETKRKSSVWRHSLYPEPV